MYRLLSAGTGLMSVIQVTASSICAIDSIWRLASLTGQILNKQTNGLEDSNLVALTRSGDMKAYELLVRRYQKLVYNVLFQMVHIHETTADLTQETFLKAYKGLPSFRAEASFKPWLLKIASNTGLNWLRDRKDHDSLDALLEDNPAVEPASAGSVEDEVEWNLSQAMLDEALGMLPARHRHIFTLRYKHDLSYEDISTIINEPETTIKSLLFRVRERLRKILIERMRVE